MKKINNISKRILIGLLMFTMVITTVLLAPGEAVYATKTPRLNVKEVVLKVGETKKLVVKNTKKKVSWSSENRSVAVVDKKGNIVAKKEGVAYIDAKTSGKKLKCKVTVITRRFSLYNSKSEKHEVAKGCSTYSRNSLLPFLQIMGDEITENAVWSSDNEKIAYVMPSGDLRAVGYGKVLFTAVDTERTYRYEINFTKENIYALTKDDFEIANVKIIDQHNVQIEKGQTSNMVDAFPMLTNDRDFSATRFSILDSKDNIVQTKRGIKIGSTMEDVYAAYGFHYVRPWNKNMTYLDVDGHEASSTMICHYGVKEKKICYQLTFTFDTENRVIDISYCPHIYH